MKVSEVLKESARAACATVAGSTLGGSIFVFVFDFRPMDHGPERSFTVEAALAGALFGFVAGLIYGAPIAAIVSGILTVKVSQRAARRAAWAAGVVAFGIWIVMLIVGLWDQSHPPADPALPAPAAKEAI